MSEMLQLTVTGMTCGGCENAVRRTLLGIDGIEDVTASHSTNQVGVTFDPERVTQKTIREQIAQLGYDVAP